jgi:Secretion system C-terminal sorting domain
MNHPFRPLPLLLFLLAASLQTQGQNSIFEPEKQRYKGTKHAYPWTLTARTGLIDDYCTQFMKCSDVDTIPRQKIDKWYISETVKGYWEYLPDDYDNPDKQQKTYPLIIYVAGCGSPSNGVLYLNTNNSINRSKGLGRILGEPLPSYLLTSPRYFSNVKIKSLAVSPVKTLGTEGFIILMLQSSGPERCLPYTLASADDVDSAINRAMQNYRVDYTRIYVTGVSGGGESVYQYPAVKDEFARKVTAIAPVCATDWLMGPRSDEFANRIVDNGVSVLGVCNRYDFTIGGLTFKMNRLTMLNIMTASGIKPYQADTAFFTYPGQAPNVSNHDAYRKGYYPNIPEYYTPIDYGGPLWTDPATGEPYNLYEWFLTKTKVSALSLSSINLSATKTDTAILLAWSSQFNHEENVYTMERSLDGVNFQPIFSKKCSALSQTGNKYVAYDRNPPASNYVFYRMKLTTQEKKDLYSKTVKVKITDRKFNALIYPRFTNNTLTIKLPKKSTATITIIDIHGRILTNKEYRPTQEIIIDISSYASGNYILQIQAAGFERQVEKIFKY